MSDLQEQMFQLLKLIIRRVFTMIFRMISTTSPKKVEAQAQCENYLHEYTDEDIHH